MSKLQSIIDWLKRKPLTLEELNSIDKIISEKRFELLAKKFASEKPHNHDATQERAIEPDKARVTWFEELDKLMEQEIARRVDQMRLHLKSLAVIGVQNVIMAAVDAYKESMEQDLLWSSDFRLFTERLTQEKQKWELRHQQYLEEMKGLIDNGHPTDPVVFTHFALVLALLSLDNYANREIRPYLQVSTDLKTGQTYVDGRPHDLLWHMAYMAQLTAFYKIEMTVLDNLRANSNDPSFACWAIMYELQDHDGELSFTTVQQLDIDWIHNNLEASPTHEILLTALQIAHRSIKSDKSVTAFSMSEEAGGYSESYIKRFRQWYRTIDEHQGDFSSFFSKELGNQ